MASISAQRNKTGEITGYRLRACVGRDDGYKQVWRTATIPRPEGLTPKREEKEVQRIADEWERAQKAEYDKTHAKVDKAKITLAAFVREHWWPDHVLDGNHKPSTIADYEYMVNIILAYFGEAQRLRTIDTEAVKRFVKFLRTEATTKRGEPYSAATIQTVYRVLSGILRYAQRLRYIDRDPCGDLTASEKPQREKGKSIDFLTPEQARAFLAALEGEPLFWRVCMNVLITCGLRRGEAVGLQWRDINGENLTLTVERNVTPDRNAEKKYNIGSTKTGGSRTVPLTPRVYGLLMQLKHDREERLGVLLLPTTFVFCRPSNAAEPIFPTEVTNWLRKFEDRHDLRHVSPHDLRHTAATLALESGANLKEVQALLGHADPQMTLRHYTGISEEAQRRTVEGIDSLIG